MSAGWARGPGSAKMNIKSTPVVDPLPAKRAVEECSVVSVRSGGLGTWQSDPRLLKLSFDMWNVTSLVAKEPELVFETERHWLDIVRLASTHSLGSGVRLPNVRGSEQGWVYLYSPIQCLHFGVLSIRQEGCFPGSLCLGM